jgi:heptaprenyl diphosphate synthase
MSAKAKPKTMLMPQPGRADCNYRSQSQSRRLHSRLALLGSLCLFLSAIEYLIPKPLPFMRIGLANLPLLLALDIFDPGEFFLLALLKVLGQGIIGGTLFSYVFLFSLAGTFASAALMYLLHRCLGKKRIGFAGLGCAGAMASNGIQLVLARYLIFGASLRYLIPPFLASGFITGIALGLVCEYFCRHSRWYAGTEAELAETPPAETPPQAVPVQRQQARRLDLFNADELFAAGLLMALIFLLSRSIPGRVVQFFFFCLLALLSGKKINPFATLIFMAGIIFFNLLAPYGKVLAVFGPLRVTQGSLFAGLEKALNLEGLLMLSRACIKSDLKLPGTVGSLLGESLRILELMRGKRGIRLLQKPIRRGHIIAGIDRLMLEMEAVNVNENAPHREQQRNVKSILLLCVIVLLTAVIGLVPRILT